MKLRLLALATLALFTAALAHGGDDHYKEPFSRTAPFNADGLISLHNVNGNIVIATWDKNEIRIEGEKHAKTEEEL
ncbi:MAG TPA: hypothetical protein VEQ65_10935, partial [Opitutus sp.]|nr:hypothetical protein [Opitutus sp.]